MSRHRKNRKEYNIKFAQALKHIEKEIHKSLKDFSTFKSWQWCVSAVFKPSRILLCKESNLCRGNCENDRMCQHFREIIDYFFQRGYIIYPYTLFINGLPVGLNRSMGFYNDKLKNVLFINSSSFADEYRNDPINSALNVCFHEFLDALAINSLKFKIITDSIDQDDFASFISRPGYLEDFRKIYGTSEITNQDELYTHYIANNAKTKCLLEALYNDDEGFQPPEVLQRLYVRLVQVMRELEE